MREDLVSPALVANSLTQRELARVMGVPEEMVSRWKKGATSISQANAKLLRLLASGVIGPRDVERV